MYYTVLTKALFNCYRPTCSWPHLFASLRSPQIVSVSFSHLSITSALVDAHCPGCCRISGSARGAGTHSNKASRCQRHECRDRTQLSHLPCCCRISGGARGAGTHSNKASRCQRHERRDRTQLSHLPVLLL